MTGTGNEELGVFNLYPTPCLSKPETKVPVQCSRVDTISALAAMWVITILRTCRWSTRCRSTAS